jgi:hypothetical protein
MSNSDTFNKQFSAEATDVVPKEGEGLPRRHPLVADGQFIATYTAEVRTLYDSFVLSASRYGKA